ncbi:MAG: RNA ligase family protein [Chitinophagales bacterium]|nr:RNA ligase family protein [Chitinophagales bacterium]
MIKELIRQHGKDKINTLTKYPSILTLHKLGEREKLTNELTTPLEGEQLFATEKIDGTNVRIICLGDEYLIGSREFILHFCHDLYYDLTQGIVDGLKELQVKFPSTTHLSVIYGELFGGKTSANAKWYGMGKIGFRVFDVAEYDDLSVLNESREAISHWREHETETGIVYGQKFLTRKNITARFSELQLVPEVNFEFTGLGHAEILESLKRFIPSTKVALTENALGKAEGIVLRNEERKKIVKVRFEDYERTLKK